jgi:hypothetical protein
MLSPGKSKPTGKNCFQVITQKSALKIILIPVQAIALNYCGTTGTG